MRQYPSKTCITRPGHDLEAQLSHLRGTSGTVIEVDPCMIDPAGLTQRIDPDDPDLAQLIHTIDTYGQLVPVLLRVSPNDPQRYDVIAGRRRVAAQKARGGPVKALIRDLDDHELIITQGYDNTARKDLTFIEKANFARQMRDASYERSAISDALSIDKSLVTRLLQIADATPLPLITAIGSAPGIGRDRWRALAEKLDGRDMTAAATGDTSDARFAAVMRALAQPTKTTTADPITTIAGEPLASVKKTKTRTTLIFPTSSSAGFDDWLITNLPSLHRNWIMSERA